MSSLSFCSCSYVESYQVSDIAPHLTATPAPHKAAMSEEAGDDTTKDSSPREPLEGDGNSDGSPLSPGGPVDGQSAPTTSLDGAKELPTITLDDAGPALSHLSKGDQLIPTQVFTKSGRTKAPIGRRVSSRKQRKANVPKQVVLPMIEDEDEQDEVQRREIKRYFGRTGMTLTICPHSVRALAVSVRQAKPLGRLDQSRRLLHDGLIVQLASLQVLSCRRIGCWIPVRALKCPGMFETS